MNYKNVKELILLAVDSTLKDFLAYPPEEAYSSGDGYFDWQIFVCDSNGNSLFEGTVECSVSELENVIMSGDPVSLVEDDVRQCFKDFLYKSEASILLESAEQVDLEKSYFHIYVTEVVDGGSDVWKYYIKDHFFDTINSSKSDSDSNAGAIKKVTRDPWDLEKLDDVFKADKEVVMAALQNTEVWNSGAVLEFASDTLKADKEVVIAAIKNSANAFKFAADELKLDQDVFSLAIKNGLSLGELPEELKADKELVLGAVFCDGQNLYHAAEALKNDKDIVRAALKSTSDTFKSASDSLKVDKEIISELIKSDDCSYAFASLDSKYKADKELVMKAVSKDPQTLLHASDQLKADKEVVLAALQNDSGWSCLEYAADTLKADKEIVMEFCKVDSQALEYASEDLKADRKFVLSIIQSGGYAYYAFSSVSESLKEDREFVMEALKANANIYEYIPGAFKAEKEIVLAYVSNAKFFPFGSILEDIPQEFQTDKDVIKSELENNGTSLAAAIAIGLEIDKEMFLSILKRRISKAKEYHEERGESTSILGGLTFTFKDAPENLKGDKDIVMTVLEHAPRCLQYVSPELLLDKEVVLGAIRDHNEGLSDIMECVPDAFKADKEFISEAAKINPNIMKFAAKELLSNQKLFEHYLHNGSYWLHDENIDAEYKGRKELVLPIIKKDGYSLQYVSQELKADKDVVMAAVIDDASAIEWASSELQADKEVALTALKQNKDLIRLIDWSLLSEKDFIFSI